MRARQPVQVLAVLALGWIAAAGARGQRGGVLASTVAQAPAAAEGPELDRQVHEIASSLRCPVCYGLSVEDSPSALARDMKETMRDMLAAGRSPDEVRAYFVSRYGEWILLKPKARGFNLVVWLLPVATVLAGVAVIWVAVRKWTRPPIGTDEASGE